MGDSPICEWDDFVEQYGGLVFEVAWRILCHAQDAEDVVQEVFVEVYRMQSHKQVECWPALLRRMATCRAIDRLRTRKPSMRLDDVHLLGDSTDPLSRLIGQDLGERLRVAIASLSERQASVFCLRFFEDQTYRQIADALNISTAAVGDALLKARTRLESLLNETRESQDERERR